MGNKVSSEIKNSINGNSRNGNLLFFSVLGLLLITVLTLSLFVTTNIIFPVPEIALQSFNFSQHGTLKFDDAFRGTNPNSNVTFVIFSDFRCPSCIEQHADLERLMMNYTDVNFLFKYLPRQDEVGSRFEVAAFECAKNAGYTLLMHSYLYESTHSSYEIIKYAESLGIDRKFFDNCTNSSLIDRIIAGDASQAALLDVKGTPTVFLNGIKIEGAHSYDVYARMIEAEVRTGAQK